MSASSLQFLVFALGVVGAALVGGSVPLWSRHSTRRLELFLAASCGVMLAVLGGHMLPEAFEAGPQAAWAVVAGFVFMLLVERFVLPHALHAPHLAEEHAGCDPAVEAEHARADVAGGVGAFLGLALHTLADGLALGASMQDLHVAPFVFLAIVAHKVPSSFALGSILVRAGARPLRVLLACALLGAMVGLGGVLFFLVERLAAFDPRALAPYAVAFSAGSFLHVAVTDLLPDLHRAGSAKRDLVLAFSGGLGAMILVSLLFHE